MEQEYLYRIEIHVNGSQFHYSLYKCPIKSETMKSYVLRDQRIPKTDLDIITSCLFGNGNNAMYFGIWLEREEEIEDAKEHLKEHALKILDKRQELLDNLRKSLEGKPTESVRENVSHVWYEVKKYLV